MTSSAPCLLQFKFYRFGIGYSGPEFLVQCYSLKEHGAYSASSNVIIIMLAKEPFNERHSFGNLKLELIMQSLYGDLAAIYRKQFVVA